MTQCTAVEHSGGEVTFDPRSRTPNSTPHTVAGEGLSGVACPSVTQCTAVGSGGEVTFDPTSSTPNSTRRTVDSGRSLSGVACPSATQCTAVEAGVYRGDAGGGEVTFDPTSSTPNSTPRTVNRSGQGLSGVACPSATQCTAVDCAGGDVTFDPTSSTPNSTPHTVDSHSLTEVACPSPTQCTAVADAGNEVTFDPTSSTPNTTPHTVDSARDLVGLACPSTTQCTAVESYTGGEVTFDPTSSTPNASPLPVGSGGLFLRGVACPSVTQCTAVDSAGPSSDTGAGEVTFDPTSGVPNSTQHTVDSSRGLTGLACPSVTQCTTVDAGGGEVTFDPTSGTPDGVRVHVADANALSGVACASISECVTVDGAGNGFTRVARVVSVSAPAAARTGRLISVRSLSAMFLGGHTPTGAVRFRVFGPRSSAPTDCSTGAQTVGSAYVRGDGSYHPSGGYIPPSAGDYWWYAAYSGNASNNSAGSRCGPLMTETVVSSAPPAAPRISGVARIGRALTEHHGRWSTRPTGYRYRWYDCTRSGQSYRAITGASARRYRLTAHDRGHTIRVSEQALTPTGVSPVVFSAQVGPVTAPRRRAKPTQR